MSRNPSAPARPSPTPPTPPAPPLGVPPPLPSPTPVGEDEIRVLAYRRWLDAGSPEGDGERFWLQAEQELKS